MSEKRRLEKPEYLLIDVKFDKMKTIFRYKSYYKAHEVGDLVVVESPKDFVNRLGKYQVGKIVWVDENTHDDIENKDELIIQRVSFRGYNNYNHQVEEIKESIIDVDEEWNKLSEEEKKELLNLNDEEENEDVETD